MQLKFLFLLGTKVKALEYEASLVKTTTQTNDTNAKGKVIPELLTRLFLCIIRKIMQHTSGVIIKTAMLSLQTPQAKDNENRPKK